MRAASCEQCGATLGAASCGERFAELLALDHSRQEPWGSRHGLAFAAFTLQHPAGQSPATLERCWSMLFRVYVIGEHRTQVATAMRRYGTTSPEGAYIPPLSTMPDGAHSFSFTLADMDTFPAERYAADLDAWCLATIDAWVLGR
jgi:hypothetical protein